MTIFLVFGGASNRGAHFELERLIVQFQLKLKKNRFPYVIERLSYFDLRTIDTEIDNLHGLTFLRIHRFFSGAEKISLESWRLA